MRRILTITLNPALDMASAAASVEPGPKLRCETARLDPGGGGVNVSRAIAKLGRESHTFVATGGPTGETFRTLLEAEGQTATWFSIPHDTRLSLAVFDRSSAQQYRFILPGPSWDDALLQACERELRAVILAEDIVVFSGSLPPGVPTEFINTLVQICTDARADAALDISGEALATAARSTGTGLHVLRMDQREAGELIGVTRPDAAAVETLARTLVQGGVARIAVIALGAKGGIAVSATEGWLFRPPIVPVLSTTGAGDSFVAGFVIGQANGWSLADCATFATATAAAAVQTEATELCRLDLVEAALPAVSCVAL